MVGGSPHWPGQIRPKGIQELVAENTSARVVALDNLRVAAMLLGLVTHGVLPYTASGLAGFPVRDGSRTLFADAIYLGIHDFRMQLFFLLAGFAGTALATRRGVGEFVRNRLVRIALPMGVAVLTVGPLVHLLFTWHAADSGKGWDADHAGGWVGPNFHLWFLYYLLLVCVPLVAVLTLGRSIPAGVVRTFDTAVRAVATSWWKYPLLAVLSVPILWDMKAWLVDTPTTWLPDVTVYLYYLGFFLTGAVLFRHRDLLPAVGRRWPIQLGVANLLLLPLVLWLVITGNWWQRELTGDVPWSFVGWKAGGIALGAAYTWLSVAGLIGLFQRHLVTQAGWWKYLAGGSYWCYLAGFPIQAALQVWFARVGLPAVTEFLVVNALTFLALLASYEVVVRRTWIGRVLNGLKPTTTSTRPVPVVVRERLPLPTVGRGAPVGRGHPVRERAENRGGQRPVALAPIVRVGGRLPTTDSP
jgi:glucan biosynthesis protein C